MTKKRIIAYALAITGLFGVYKWCHKLGEHIKENYLNESFSDSTLNNETTINETLSAIIPTETTIIPETTFIEETVPETYAEVDISDQKVYCYYQGELVLVADCVTGIPTYGTTKGTNKGYTEINGKSYNTTLMLDTPAEIFVSFNPDGEVFHDSKRSQFGGDIYLTNGSHGCVNMRLEDVKVLDKHLKVGDHVLVHK